MDSDRMANSAELNQSDLGLHSLCGHLCTKPKTNNYKLSPVMRKPAFCICKNEGADQLCSLRAADQHLCLCHIDSTIPPLLKS